MVHALHTIVYIICNVHHVVLVPCLALHHVAILQFDWYVCSSVYSATMDTSKVGACATGTHLEGRAFTT